MSKRGAGIRLPKIKTHKPLYCYKAEVATVELIDQISEKLDVPKHLVINNILSTSLGVEPTQKLNLKKWLKKF